jgi:hypothetical protein
MYSNHIKVIKSIMEKTDGGKEVTVVEAKPVTVDDFIAQAIQANAPVETMERLFALHREVKADHAREAFVLAMAKFQSECPTIEKTKHVLGKDGKVRYSFAPLDAIVSQVKAILVRNGLSYSVDAEVTATDVKATCKITHSLGHSETSSFSAPIDKEGYMTAPQKVASALTFAKRYAFTNALGILTGDEDVDATDVKTEKKPADVKSQIVFCLRQLGLNNKTREEIEQSVKQTTKLELTPENYDEIKNRLEVMITERNSDTSNEQ